MSKSVDTHRRGSDGLTARCAVLTISDSRTAENDGSGDLLVSKLLDAGHEVRARQWVKDEPAEVEAILEQWIAGSDIQVVLTTGGTGVSRRDSTVEAVEKLLDKRLDGFGELFRMLSYQQVGSAAMMSRAVAGLSRGVLVFSVPGSPAAVELALDRLIIPEMPHLLFERSR